MATLTMFGPYLDLTVSASNHWTIASATKDKVILQSDLQQLVISGNFQVSATGEVTSGSATSLDLYQTGYDGHRAFQATGLALDAAQLVGTVLKSTFDGDIWSSILSGNDTIIGSDGKDGLQGFAGNDTIQAGAGDDHIGASAGNDAIDGGAGFDIVNYHGVYADARIERSGSGYTVADLKGGGGVDTLANVERAYFDDKYVALFSADSTGGTVWRLYEAAFGRGPDAVGFDYWTQQVDAHHLDAATIAGHFVNSDEYRLMYGTGLSNRELVSKYYEHVLQRAPDQGGLDFWTNVLDRKAATAAEVLARISESPENVAHSVQLIGVGLVFDVDKAIPL